MGVQSTEDRYGLPEECGTSCCSVTRVGVIGSSNLLVSGTVFPASSRGTALDVDSTVDDGPVAATVVITAGGAKMS